MGNVTVVTLLFNEPWITLNNMDTHPSFQQRHKVKMVALNHSQIL